MKKLVLFAALVLAGCGSVTNNPVSVPGDEAGKCKVRLEWSGYLDTLDTQEKLVIDSVDTINGYTTSHSVYLGTRRDTTYLCYSDTTTVAMITADSIFVASAYTGVNTTFYVPKGSNVLISWFNSKHRQIRHSTTINRDTVWMPYRTEDLYNIN